MTPYILGVLGLVVMWANSLLQIAAIRIERRELLDEWSGVAWRRGTAREGEGASGAFATHRLTQTGHARAGKARLIDFSEAGYAAELHGGVIAVGGVSERVEPSTDAEVWPSPERLVEVAGRGLASDAFQAAWDPSCKPRGWDQVLETAIGEGDSVWIGDAPGRTVYSALDPAQWLATRTRFVTVWTAGVLSACALATAVCLVPPFFGPVSIVGAFLAGGVFFAGPATAYILRALLRAPSRPRLRTTIDESGAVIALSTL